MLVTVGLTLAGVIPVDLTIRLGCDVLLTAWLLKACWACRQCRGRPWASPVKWHDGLLPGTRGKARWADRSEWKGEGSQVPGHKDQTGGQVTITGPRTTDAAVHKAVPQPRRRQQPREQGLSNPSSASAHQRGPTRRRDSQRFPPDPQGKADVGKGLQLREQSSWKGRTQPPH